MGVLPVSDIPTAITAGITILRPPKLPGPNLAEPEAAAAAASALHEADKLPIGSDLWNIQFVVTSGLGNPCAEN